MKSHKNSPKETKVFNIVQGLWGGVGKYAHQVAHLNNNENLSIYTIVINTKHWPRHQQLLDDGIDKEILIKSRFDFSWIKLCSDEIIRCNPDMLFVHGFNGPLMGMLIRWKAHKKTRLLCSYHGGYNSPSIYKKPLAPIINFILYKIYLHFANKIVTVSNFSRNYLIKKNIPKHKIDVIHNGLTSQYRPNKTKRNTRLDWKIPQESIIIGWSGRFAPEKGVQYLIKAFKHTCADFHNTHLVLAGDGNQIDKIKSLVKKYKLESKVHFLGLIDDIDTFLNGIDIYVLPSIQENHSIALLEAMRASKAIIATDVGGNGESIRHEKEGLLIPPFNSLLLSKALSSIIKDSDCREKFGHAARQRFLQKFNYENTVANISNWLISTNE